MITASELIEALKDPEVVAVIKTLLRPSPISPIEHKKVDRITSWYTKESGKESELSIFQKQDLLKLIGKFGLREVKLVLKQALDSPLNTEGQFMKPFLTNLQWCIKSGNFTKIKEGNYDEVFKKKDAPHVDTNNEQLTGLE